MTSTEWAGVERVEAGSWAGTRPEDELTGGCCRHGVSYQFSVCPQCHPQESIEAKLDRIIKLLEMADGVG